MQVIKNWLAGNMNYIAGRCIYSVYGSDDALKKIFSLFETDIRRREMVKAIQRIITNNTGALPLAEPAAKETDMPESSNPVLQALRNEWLPLYQDMNYKRHQLDKWGDVNTGPVKRMRYDLAVEVLGIEQQCMVIWARRDYYIKHGKLPEVKEKKLQLPTDPVELGKLIEGTKKNVRRNKLLMKQNPGNASFVQRHADYTLLLQKLTGQKPPSSL